MRGRAAAVFTALIVAVAVLNPLASGASGSNSRPDAAGTAFARVKGEAPPTHDGAPRVVDASHARNFTLDEAQIDAVLPAAPASGTRRSSVAPATLALPAPDGSTQRFEVSPVKVMADGLAAAHPEIQTFQGTGLDDPGSTLRITQSPLGFQASVRGGELGAWYVDPTYHDDTSLYSSYFGPDLKNRHGALSEAGLPGEAEAQKLSASDTARGLSAGDKLHTYRLALLSDPGYAKYFDGGANVTAAKVALMNRVDQVYEDEVAVRLILISQTDDLNLNSYADAIAPNGPCGADACYSRDEVLGCSGQTLDRTRYVAGQIVGAENFDIGHLALGQDGGGIAGLGVVGRAIKAEGCTGIPKPDGDFYAVDYVAHEMGHQFGGNHTFNGDSVNCGGGNRNAGTSVEPGSGSSIMAYAGICGQDNLQPHSDPYFSQRSFQEITAYVNSNRPAVNETQNVALRHFGGGNEIQVATFGPGFTTKSTASKPSSSFKIVIGGVSTPKIGGTGVAFNNANLQSAINTALANPASTFPAGSTAKVSFADSSGTGFTVSFGGGATGIDLPNFQLIDVSDCKLCFSSVEETRHGGTNDSFKLTYGVNTSSTITRGSNYTIDGIQAALTQILPVGATADVSGYAGGDFDESGFEVDLGGTLAGDPANLIGLTNFSPGASGFAARTDSGGPATNKGAQTSTDNSPPVVTAPSSYTIPYRTPFKLTGSATDADSDPLTYMWEQNDTSQGATKLVSPKKRAGALFREFGKRLDTSVYDEHAYDSPGENHTTADPSRTFPDMGQILSNNTDARTGDCPGAPAPKPPSSGIDTNVKDRLADCYSEFLPTSLYKGPMHFRLTARDGSLGGGGVGSDDTKVKLAKGTGPFLVKFPNKRVKWKSGSAHVFHWEVAGTSGGEIRARRVEISLSTDGGHTYPTTLATTRNDGTAKVRLPNVTSGEARVKISAVGNIFFDVSNANFKLAH